MDEAKDIRDGAWTRKKRFESLLNLVQASPQTEEDRIVTLFAVHTGLSRTRCQQYIDELCNCGLVERKNGRVLPKSGQSEV